MNNLLLSVGFILLLQFTALGQSTTTDSSAVKAPVKAVVEAQPKEEVKDGIWAVGEYLGKKLVDELGDRMNLGETTEPIPRKPRKVTLKLGSFKIERFE